jgi:hypothetical protein
MPISVTRRVDASALGVSCNVDEGVQAEDGAIARPSIPRAKVGSLTLRTDNTTGELTLEAAHGVTTAVANKLDVYWAGGKRTGCVVGTVAGNVVPISGGAGDNLPVLNTAVTAMVPQKENFNTIGDNTVAIIAKADTRATIKLQTAVPAVILTINLESGDAGYSWTTAAGIANPLAGQTIASVLLSHDDGVNAREVRVVAPYN